MSAPTAAAHEVQDLIGRGSVGSVYRAIGVGGKPCAVKVFGAMSINRKGLAHTLRLLQQMPPHLGVLPVLGFDMDHSPYHLTMPLVGMMTKDAANQKAWQSTTLESLCGRIPPDKAWMHIYDIADAMAWLHKHGIAHGSLKCSNVLLADDSESAIRIADMGQGYVGGVHHMEPRDHFMYLCPEQAERPDDFFVGKGPSWDVYSFGVVAYRLLTGHFPRADQAWVHECAVQQQKMAQGLNHAINSVALIQGARSQPKVTWPSAPQSPWDERRRQIIERALSLDEAMRWRDMREVSHEFEKLEADYALEESRAETVAERKKQVGKIRRLHLLWTTLAVLLGLAVAYGFGTKVMLIEANKVIDSNLAREKNEIATRDAKIEGLAKETKQAIEAKADSDHNLKRAELLVDQLVTQLVQLPTGNELEVAFSKQQLSETAAWIQQQLPGLEKDDGLAPERARAFGNLGMIALKQRNTAEAVKYLDKARNELHALVSREPDSPHINQYHQWLGRFSLLLANMRAQRGDGDTAFLLLKEATANLDPGLQNNPKDRNARYEAAQAWFNFGARCRMEGKLEDSEKAFERVTAALDPTVIGDALIVDERFLLSRAELERGLALRDQGKMEQAVEVLTGGVDQMATLVASSSPKRQDQALVLAEAYTDLADIIARHFSAKAASEAHIEAIKVLLELIRLEPDWKEVKYLLARNYGEVASLERDMGNQSEALRKKQDAIELINEVVSDDSENRTYLFHQAKLRGELAELMSEGGKAKEAMPIIKQAIENLQNLLQQLPSGATMTAERREWEIQLAILHGVRGQVCESAKQRDEAKKSFQAAEKQWAKLAEQNPENETVKNGTSWVKNRLAKLK